MSDFLPDQGVCGISLAAELTGVQPQALRVYETRGLLAPARTAGGTRRYSANDLDRVRRISVLLEAGLNLAGIRHVLELEAETAELRVALDAATSATAARGGATPPGDLRRR
jgi:MerR family transcriptional regulator, heat shock protein HspR